jgi:pimeloyl-ACP methyl ester carboxylesterase
MANDRVHRVTTDDGVQIAGRVQGEGPPVVLVHGGLGSGETSYRFLAPLLQDHVTCYLVSMRGRGLSEDHADQSRERFIRDVVTFVESIGEPVGLMGQSSGAVVALEAAARTTSISSLALYEPFLREFVPEEVTTRGWDALGGIAAAIEDDRLGDAARLFLEHIALGNDEELATLTQAGAFEIVAPFVRQTFQEVAQSGRPTVSDLALLEQVRMPVLLLHGSETHPSYPEAMRFLDRRLADSRVRVVEGVGHLAPQVAPADVAAELVNFFAEVAVPARTGV